MNIDNALYEKLLNCNWFRNCGTRESIDFGFEVSLVTNEKEMKQGGFLGGFFCTLIVFQQVAYFLLNRELRFACFLAGIVNTLLGFIISTAG